MNIRDEIDDARYGVRAWSRDRPWSSIIAGLGVAITGYAWRDAAILATGVAAVVVGLIPGVKANVVYEIVRTGAMRRGWIAVPEAEKPTTTREIVIGGKGVAEHEK